MTSSDFNDSRPWQLVRAALPRAEADACTYSELWLRCQCAPHLVDAGLDALRAHPGGTLRMSAGRYWYAWRTTRGSSSLNTTATDALSRNGGGTTRRDDGLSPRDTRKDTP